jgi:DNA (cytosine-5)-methyltransferase 1
LINYYNEIDPKAAAWLRELIKDGHIANGIVDERSIKDVQPNDLTDFTQCHFFAGIGGWSYALRLAEWPDDRPVWTGSCPCQPFSAAGKRGGTDDARHLWPEFYRLIRECRPPVIFGEQVANALGWLDLVQGDLEAEDYACGAVIIGAHSVGAPHIRQRLYWVADADGDRSGRNAGAAHGAEDKVVRGGEPESDGLGAGSEVLPIDVGNARGTDWSAAEFIPCTDGKRRPIEPAFKQVANGISESLAHVLPCTLEALTEEINAAHVQADYRKEMRVLWETLLADTQRCWQNGRLHDVRQAPVLLAFMRQLADQGWLVAQSLPRSGAEETETAMRILQRAGAPTCASCGRELAEQCGRQPANPLHILSSILARHASAAWGEAFASHAADAFPLAHGVPHRVGLLRGYGNAIVPQVAAEFVRATMDSGHGQQPDKHGYFYGDETS